MTTVETCTSAVAGAACVSPWLQIDAPHVLQYLGITYLVLQIVALTYRTWIKKTPT